MDTTIAFAGEGLDRADHIRGDAEKLGALMDWRARLLKLEGIDPVIAPDGGLDWGTLADADPAAELARMGFHARNGSTFAAAQVQRMLQAA